MPVMDGWIEFIEQLQQQPECFRASAVVVLTTSTNGKDLLRVQACPINGYWKSPVC
jgi:CheY-like chemotaxis protein